MSPPHPLRYAQRLDRSSVALTIMITTLSRLEEGFYGCVLGNQSRYAAAFFAVNGSLLLEEKVLNAVKRMRCSRRSGVTF